MKSIRIVCFPCLVSLLAICVVGCRPKQVERPKAPKLPIEKTAEDLVTPGDAGKETVGISNEVPSEKNNAVVEEKGTKEESSGDLVADTSEKTPAGKDGKLNRTWQLEETLKEEESGVATWRRFGLMLDGGPLLIDFRTSVGAASLTKVEETIRARLVHEFFGEGKDSMLWSELLEHPKVKSGFFQNLRSESTEQNSQLLQLYDRDRNGEATSKELLAFLTRGISERGGFILDEASRYRDDNRDRSPTFVRMDSNRDGVLDRMEIGTATQRIRSMDSNADFILNASEIRSLDLNPDQYVRQRQVSATNLALPFARSNAKELSRQLLSKFSIGDELLADDWSGEKSLFDQLDSNRDRVVNRTELEKIVSAPPRMVFEFRLDGIDIADSLSASAESTLTAYSLAEGGEFETSLIELPGLRMKLRSLDPLSKQNLDQRIDSLAKQLGITKEASISLGEIPNSVPNGQTYSIFDVDSDEKVSWMELKGGVLSKASLTAGIVRVRLIDVPDSWFTWLDTNWDGLLSEIELSLVETRLLGLMTDRDSALAPESLPVQLELVVARQYGEEDPFGPDTSAALYRDTTSSPPSAWFSSMDSNGDGVVTPREFLGSSKSFQSLDRDGNLLLDSRDLISSP